MLESQRFLIREHVGALRLTDVYDVVDPDSGEILGSIREVIGSWKKAARIFLPKSLLSTTAEVREGPDEALLFTIHRHAAFFSHRVDVIDAQDQPVGFFRSKVLTLGGGLHVFTADGRAFAEVKAKNLVGFEYRFQTPDGTELGTISKQIESIARELFTSADCYLVTVVDELREEPLAKMLLLAAAISLDMIFKESN